MNFGYRLSVIIFILGAGIVAGPRFVSARSWAQGKQCLPSAAPRRAAAVVWGQRAAIQYSAATAIWAQGKQYLPSAAPLPTAAWLAEQPSGNKPSRPSSHKDLFDWINFILLVVVLIYVLRKPVGHFFESRSAALQHDLEEGRKALEAARTELARAEEKMRRLEADIAAFKASAIQERELELTRLRQASEEEGKRILESARNMIESATQAARLELKRTAANEAVALAEKMIRERLDEAGRTRLVSRFLDGIR